MSRPATEPSDLLITGASLLARASADVLVREGTIAAVGPDAATDAAAGTPRVDGDGLVLLPGFLSDVLGILCLLPFTRAVPRRLLADLVQRRAARFTGPRVVGEPVRDRGPASAPRGQVLQGEVVDDDRKHL